MRRRRGPATREGGRGREEGERDGNKGSLNGTTAAVNNSMKKRGRHWESVRRRQGIGEGRATQNVPFRKRPLHGTDCWRVNRWTILRANAGHLWPIRSADQRLQHRGRLQKNNNQIEHGHRSAIAPSVTPPPAVTPPLTLRLASPVRGGRSIRPRPSTVDLAAIWQRRSDVTAASG